MASLRKFVVKVVGTTFAPDFPENLVALCNMVPPDYEWYAESEEDIQPIPASLVRNPENEYDANAIEVHVDALGSGSMLGHIPAPVAAKIAPSLDRGDAWEAVVSRIDRHPDHPDNPGVHVRLERIDEGEPF